MRAKEFITEQHGTLTNDVSRALPGTYTIPGLPNNDFYKQYRFGVAMADARGFAEREKDDTESFEFDGDSVWGENMIVSSYMDASIDKDIDYAMKKVGASGKKLISTPKSEEATDVIKGSPIKAFKGYKRK
jgi:hypothetical protein